MSYDSQTSSTLINKLRKDVDSLTQKIATLTDSKASGTAGGNGVATTWTTRELNTVASDPNGLIIDLVASEFKVAAGAYQVRSSSAFHHTGKTRMRLYDVTGDAVIGYSMSDDVSNQEMSYLHIDQRITPHKDNVYRLEYYIEANGAGHLGQPSSITGINEIYTSCEITRLDTGFTKPLGAGGLQGPQGPAGPTGPAGPPGPTGGGVTSVNVSGGTTGLSTSGGPITSSGTITLSGVVAVTSGGTGASDAATALTNLGAYPASNPSGYTNNTGTVTSFGFTNANGVSGTVTNATSTPNLTVSLGAITPTSVAASGTVTGSNLSGSNTGDQTITLTGDVTGSGTGSFAATIANNAVTAAKFQQIATDRLVGRDTAGTGNVEQLTVGGGVEFTGSGGIQSSAYTGDVTKVAGGTSQTIANSAVTYAKIQDVSAASRLLGRGAGAGAGVTQEIALGTGLSMSGTTLSASAAGTVTSVAASGGTTGMTFSGSPVTTAGTLTLDGTLAIANGGTGATTAANAVAAIGAYPASNPNGYTSNVGTVTNVSVSGGANLGVLNGSTTPVISQIAASSVANGYMTSTYAAKLDGIAAGASVTSVSATGGTTGLSFTGGPITSSGTLVLNGTLNADSGGTGHTAPTVNGQLLIGNAVDEVWDKATLTAGTGISITNGPGTITIANTGSGSGDVVGPASATQYELSRFTDSTGKEIDGASWYSNGGDLHGDAGFKTMQYGYIWIPSGTGGQPSTPAQYSTLSGRAPMYFDRTNSRLYIFNEDVPGWKYVDLS